MFFYFIVIITKRIIAICVSRFNKQIIDPHIVYRENNKTVLYILYFFDTFIITSSEI